MPRPKKDSTKPSIPRDVSFYAGMSVSQVDDFIRARLAHARESRNMTFQDLATSSGLSKQTLQHYFHGTRNKGMRMDCLLRIARALNLPLSFFLPEDHFDSTQTRVAIRLHDILNRLPNHQAMECFIDSMTYLLDSMALARIPPRKAPVKLKPRKNENPAKEFEQPSQLKGII